MNGGSTMELSEWPGEGAVHVPACRVAAHALLKAFQEDRFIFGYSGHFSDDLTGRLLDLSDSITTAMSGQPAHRRRLAFLLVEAYQNIIRHRAGMPAHIEQGEGRSFFFCRANPSGHDLVAINGVCKGRVGAIAAQLDAVRGLDHAELKELSMRMLQLPSVGRGAGVGFIEMTRRSGNDLGHMLRGLGPEHALFALAVRSGDTHPHEKVLREAAILHGTVVMNDILLFHAGHVPTSFSSVIASMLRNDVEPPGDPGRATRREALYSTWAEVLHGVCADARSVCVLARTPGGMVMVQGVEVCHEETQSIMQALSIAASGMPDTGRDAGGPVLTVHGHGERRVLLIAERC
ncbi:MAG: hypothetical protein KF797_05050 [Flavobacteriales bacterium]|nr:hypothetical protein [Flavobacteriales bacterium]